jgi:hypothetical protein
MEVLRWWLLLLTAVMFSMSGCATQDVSIWSTNHAHFASAQHFSFSMKDHPSEASITEDDVLVSAREEWWGRPVPDGAGSGALYAPAEADAPQAALPSMDMTGKWRGTWMSRGLFGDERVHDALAVFSQSGKRGVGRIALADVNAAIGLPVRLREAGTFGVPVFYNVDGADVVARDQGGSSLKLTFTRVGDVIYGRIIGAPAPTVLVLEREIR